MWSWLSYLTSSNLSLLLIEEKIPSLTGMVENQTAWSQLPNTQWACPSPSFLSLLAQWFSIVCLLSPYISSISASNPAFLSRDISSSLTPIWLPCFVGFIPSNSKTCYSDCETMGYPPPAALCPYKIKQRCQGHTANKWWSRGRTWVSKHILRTLTQYAFSKPVVLQDSGKSKDFRI